MRKLFVVVFIVLGFYIGSQESFVGYNYYEIKDSLVAQGWEFKQNTVRVDVFNKNDIQQRWYIDEEGIIFMDRQIYLLNPSNSEKAMVIMDTVLHDKRFTNDAFREYDPYTKYIFFKYDYGTFGIAPRSHAVSISMDYDLWVFTFYSEVPEDWQ
jgi:hypothetical protein